jgi:tRNA-Thr(GGU) m(6)t(6)A37 methyltransferase TsaA
MTPAFLMNATTFELRPIGRVESPLTALEAAPRQADEGAPSASLVFDEHVRDGIGNLRPGDQLILLTWLDRAQRDVLVVHPRGDTSRPREGVFSTRSPHRPNPIGLHRVQVVAVAGLRVQVDHLEALNGTPIVDVKPVLAEDVGDR